MNLKAKSPQGPPCAAGTDHRRTARRCAGHRLRSRGLEITSTNGCGEGFSDWWGALQGETERGERIGYAIRRLSDKRVVGTSSFLNIRRIHKGVEIGATFLHPDVRSGPVNPSPSG